MINKKEKIKKYKKSRVRSILGQLKGKKVNHIEKGHGSFLTIDLGLKSYTQKENFEYSLWIYLCDWKINHRYSNRTYFRSESISQDDNHSLKLLFQNTSLKLLRQSSSALHIIFDNYIEIILSESLNSEGDDWLIISEKNNAIASFNKSKGLYLA